MLVDGSVGNRLERTNLTSYSSMELRLEMLSPCSA